MESQKFIHIEGKGSVKKRKFTPNISKALAKKSQANNANSIAENYKPQGSAKKPNVNRPHINSRTLNSNEPRFVQSYSIFESGLGCVEKDNRRSVELSSFTSRGSKMSMKTVTESQPLVMDDSAPSEFAMLSNVHQVYKYPPNIMPPDPPEVAVQFTESPLRACLDSSVLQNSSSTSTVHELFDENAPNGKLFSLRIPDALISEDSPLQKRGKIGKIQILDNGETRLVIGDCFFRLTSPGAAPYSTDVVLVEDEEEGGVVNLTSIGHIEQFVTAVPDLDHFIRLGS